MNCKKVLFVTGTLGFGGIERQITDLCLNLQKIGEWQPSVCCILRKEGGFLPVLEQHNIPIYECSLTRRNILSFPLRFARLLNNVKPDVVHSHVASALPWQVMGTKLAGVRVFIVTQQNEYNEWRNTPMSLLRLRFYYSLVERWISKHTVISKKVQVNLAGLVNRDPADFPVIYNSVNMEQFQMDILQRDNARREMGILSDAFVVGNVARLVEQKGQSYLIEAASIIQKTDQGVRFVIIGDGPLRSELQAKVELLGLSKIVTFLGSRSDIPYLLNGLDCFALSSLWEGGPIVIEEAMASHIPVISTPVGMAPEALADDCGLLVPPANPEALASAVIQLKQNPELRQRLVLNAYRRVQSCFGLNVVSEAYTALYHDCLISSREPFWK